MSLHLHESSFHQTPLSTASLYHPGDAQSLLILEEEQLLLVNNGRIEVFEQIVPLL